MFTEKLHPNLNSDTIFDPALEFQNKRESGAAFDMPSPMDHASLAPFNGHLSQPTMSQLTLDCLNPEAQMFINVTNKDRMAEVSEGTKMPESDEWRMVLQLNLPSYHLNDIH